MTAGTAYIGNSAAFDLSGYSFAGGLAAMSVFCKYTVNC